MKPIVGVLALQGDFREHARALTRCGADTVEVFGELIHTYDMAQSQDDRSTVLIYYEPRQIRLHLSQADIDAGSLKSPKARSRPNWNVRKADGLRLLQLQEPRTASISLPRTSLSISRSEPPRSSARR